MKKCTICGEIRTLDHFGFKDKKGGRRGNCKICHKIQRKKFRQENPDYFKTQEKDRYLNPEKRAKKLKRDKKYFTTVKGRFIHLLYSAKSRARKSLLPYNLDIEWLMEKYNAQNGNCLLTGFKLTFEAHHGEGTKPFTPSLDRIDSNLGYTKDNTRLICTAMNLGMNHFGESVFRQLAEAYLNKKFITEREV